MTGRGSDLVNAGGSLRARIALKEQELLMHRQAAIDHAGLLRCRLQRAVTTPWALLAAAGLGVMLEQALRRRGDSLLSMLNTLSGGRALLMALAPLLAGATRNNSSQGVDPR